MRNILAVLAVAWLNIVLQPCAMALGDMQEHDCPRCPPSQAAEASDHALHGRHGTAEESASGEMHCALAATDCSLVDELNYDGRIVKLELNDAPNDAPIAIGPPTVFDRGLRPADYSSWHRTRSPPPLAGVPLNVYYCVYLK